MKQTIRLNETELKSIICESVQDILNEDTHFTLFGKAYTVKGDGDAKENRKVKKLKQEIIRQHKIENGEEVEEPTKPKKDKNKETIGDEQASPKGLAANVKKLISNTSLTSVKGFIDHSERQFGPNATRTLVNVFKKEAGNVDLFVKYNMIYHNILQTVDEIENWGKKNEYAVYERARKLGFLLQDIVDILEQMGSVYENLKQKKTLTRVFGNNANVIMGNGHSLGLSSLIFAKGIALSKLSGGLLATANQLITIADNGRDPFEYEVKRGGMKESKNRKMKQRVRLTERELNNMIAESVKRVLSESEIRKVDYNRPTHTFTQDEEDKLRKMLKRNKNIDEASENDFTEKYNTARQNYNRPLWGFEMKNQEGEWQYGDIEYDPNTQTMSCMGVSIEVDPSLSVDQNLEGLYDELMNNGFTDGE